jgi:hypothetical protein
MRRSQGEDWKADGRYGVRSCEKGKMVLYVIWGFVTGKSRSAMLYPYGISC